MQEQELKARLFDAEETIRHLQGTNNHLVNEIVKMFEVDINDIKSLEDLLKALKPFVPKKKK